MNEETMRHMLRHEADKHQVNPTLPRSTITRARLRRSVALMAVTTVTASVVVGGIGVARYMDESESRVPPAPGSSSDSADSSRTESGAPQVLITAQGWRVTRIDQYSSTIGEMNFTNGSRELELYWGPADAHGSVVQDREASSATSWDMTILGQESVLFQYEGATDFTALWLDGDLSMELRGVFPDVDEYRAVAASLQYVDEETWLAAMPNSVVHASERAATVDSMLEDIPVHPDVDVEGLKTNAVVADRYHLGAQVTGAVACAWIEQWVDAKAGEKDASAQEAVDAMASSREWSILVEMKDQGGWSQFIWEYADAMTGNAKTGRPRWVQRSYRDEMDCEGTE